IGFYRLASLVKTGGSPIAFKGGEQGLDHRRVTNDQSDFAAQIQLGLAQALAAHKRMAAVANNGSRMQSHTGERRHLQITIRSAETADDLDLDTGLGAIFEEPQDRFVGDLGIVDPQLLARFLDKSGELGASVDGAHDECLEAAGVGLPVQVGIEKPGGLLNYFRV